MDLIDQAAQHLVNARRARTRGERIPEAYRPQDLETALAIQDKVTELLGENVGGFKASAPKPGKIMRAPIYASNIYRSDRVPIFPRDGMAPIEPEIAFVLARDLAPGASEVEVRAAIGETRLVLELIGSRYERPEEASFPEMLADSLNHQGLVIGPVLEQGAGEWAAGFPIRIPGVFEGEGKHPDGHPLVPLYWLAGQIPLRAGHIVTTGSYAGVILAPLNQPLRVQFGSAGEIAVTFHPDSASPLQ
jgi:2-keto-4-pentenoate hydratase